MGVLNEEESVGARCQGQLSMGGGCTCQLTWLDISDLLLDSDPEY